MNYTIKPLIVRMLLVVVASSWLPRSRKDVEMLSIDLERHSQERHHDINAHVSSLLFFLSPTLNYTHILIELQALADDPNFDSATVGTKMNIFTWKSDPQWPTLTTPQCLC